VQHVGLERRPDGLVEEEVAKRPGGEPATREPHPADDVGMVVDHHRRAGRDRSVREVAHLRRGLAPVLIAAVDHRHDDVALARERAHPAVEPTRRTACGAALRAISDVRDRLVVAGDRRAADERDPLPLDGPDRRDPGLVGVRTGAEEPAAWLVAGCGERLARAGHPVLKAVVEVVVADANHVDPGAMQRLRGHRKAGEDVVLRGVEACGSRLRRVRVGVLSEWRLEIDRGQVRATKRGQRSVEQREVVVDARVEVEQAAGIPVLVRVEEAPAEHHIAAERERDRPTRVRREPHEHGIAGGDRTRAREEAIGLHGHPAGIARELELTGGVGLGTRVAGDHLCAPDRRAGRIDHDPAQSRVAPARQ
jgi:hypothetical protein